MGFIQSAVSKPLSIHCHCYVLPFLDWFHLEDLVSPRGHVEVEPLGGEVISNSVVHCHTQLVVKPPGLTGEVVPRQDYITLTVVAGVVYHHQAAGISRPTPREGDERIIAPIPFPGWAGIEELPISVAKSGVF
jgi:hypothetical protein